MYVVKKLPIAGYSVVKESEESAVPRLQLSILPKYYALSTFVVRALQAGRPKFVGRGLPAHRRASRDGRHPSPESRAKVVENTGLEPVTSWLQTRRSPS